MKYQVFDNEQSADYSGSCCNMKRGLGWDNSKFDTLQEAVAYAIKYLGDYGKGLSNNPMTAQYLMEGYVYSGGGDRIQIRQVEK